MLYIQPYGFGFRMFSKDEYFDFVIRQGLRKFGATVVSPYTKQLPNSELFF